MDRWPIALAAIAAAAIAQDNDPRRQVIGYLNSIGTAQVDQRARAVAKITTREQAEARKTAVREKILKLIGGLPERAPVSVRQFGTLSGDGFRVEKIAFESLPKFFVTADVYVPLDGGTHPAVLLWPGHEATAKLGQYNWGANLARDGIVALAIDPVGLGERLQHYDPELEESKVGQGTGEHGLAALSTMLIGENVARYFINDGMAAIDYLASRKDVDALRIGMFGCSGGGTATAYLAALDDRIKVAASACYITSFKELLPTAGPQEAEQSIPRFLAEGLDFGDWVELAAPKPYAIVSTTEDMFPFAGARQTFEEAQRIYGLYGAADKIQWITGPGQHGALAPIAPQIVAFLVHALKGSDPPPFRDSRPERAEDLLCTPTGQVSTSLGGETIESINRKRAGPIMAHDHSPTPDDIRAVTWAVARPSDPPPSIRVVKTDPPVQTIAFESEPGIELTATVTIPRSTAAKPAVLLMTSRRTDTLEADLTGLAKSGHVVMILQARGTPFTGPMTPPLLGPFNLLALRALVAGKTLVGMRVDDAVRAVNWLAALRDVDRSAITLYGYGPLGVVALHAAALDSRVARVVAENSLISYRDAIERPLHRDLAEVALPGVLRHYDIPDLIEALQRPVTLVNPVDAMGRAARNFHPTGARVVLRSARDPLPID